MSDAVLHPQRKVLIVDDDQKNLELMQEICEGQGYEVLTTSNSLEVMDMLEKFPADLVVLDQDMPGMTGLEILKKIKAKYLGTDVIFVSAQSNPRMVSLALEQGADDFIRKPFSVIEFVSRIHVRFRIRDLREELRIANDRLAELSVTDDLTGLLNMRSTYDRIDYEMRRVQRNHRQLGIVMIDMDHFKTVNDGHDHLFGSYVIKEMGELIRKNLRDVDFAARYGGDEFLIVLTDTDEAGVRTFCERLRKTVKAHVFKEGADQIKLTLSVGYAVLSDQTTVSAREFVRVADHALYEAKESGRDRVVGVPASEIKSRIKVNISKKAA